MNSPLRRRAGAPRGGPRRRSWTISIGWCWAARRTERESGHLAARFREAAPTAERGVGRETSPWRYGYGTLDPNGRARDGVRAFPGVHRRRLAAGIAATAPWKAGRARLTAAGGAPGDDLDHVVIRRWVSPIEGEINIRGSLRHNLAGIGKRFGYSNGVRGWLVSDRQGVLGMWRVQRRRKPKPD